MMDSQHGYGCSMMHIDHDDSHMYNQTMMYEMHEKCEEMMGQDIHVS